MALAAVEAADLVVARYGASRTGQPFSVGFLRFRRREWVELGIFGQEEKNTRDTKIRHGDRWHRSDADRLTMNEPKECEHRSRQSESRCLVELPVDDKDRDRA